MDELFSLRLEILKKKIVRLNINLCVWLLCPIGQYLYSAVSNILTVQLSYRLIPNVHQSDTLCPTVKLLDIGESNCPIVGECYVQLSKQWLYSFLSFVL